MNEENKTPELLAELKAYVFAMYIGQKVLYWKDFHKVGNTGILCGTNLSASTMPNQTAYLQLRPLSTITDSEAIEVAKIYEPNAEWYISKDTESYILLRSEVEYLWLYKDTNEPLFCVDDIDGGNNTPYGILSAYQYLQQSSFALPIYFKGIQYSVEQLCEYGIVQLTHYLKTSPATVLNKQPGEEDF